MDALTLLIAEILKYGDIDITTVFEVITVGETDIEGVRLVLNDERWLVDGSFVTDWSGDCVSDNELLAEIEIDALLDELGVNISEIDDAKEADTESV